MSNEYWAKRVEQENAAALHRTIKETNKELRKLYEKQAKNLYDELIRVFIKMEEDNAEKGKIYINDLYRTNSIYELLNYFNECSKKIGGKQVKITERALIKAYEEAQEIVGANAPKSIVRSQFVVPSAVDTKQIVNQTWCVDGLNFSDRIWKNKENLTQDLSKTLSDLVMRGKSPYQISKGVVARLGVDENAAYRIVRTETAHAQVTGQADKYKAMGFTHGRFHATDPCEDCGELDGKLFTLDELKTMLPRHPNCECSFLLEVN